MGSRILSGPGNVLKVSKKKLMPWATKSITLNTENPVPRICGIIKVTR